MTLRPLFEKLGRYAVAVILLLLLAIPNHSSAQDTLDGKALAGGAPDFQVVVYGDDAYWMLPLRKDELVRPRFLDGDGLSKEIAQYRKRAGKDAKVIVLAKGSTPYGQVVTAMEICQEGGVSDVALSIQEEVDEFAPASLAAVEGSEPELASASDAPEVADDRGGLGRDETRISSRTEGYVVKVAVRLGDKVEQGQVLVEMDPTEQQLFLRMAEAKIESTKADVTISEASQKLARRDFEQAKMAAEKGVVTGMEQERAMFNVTTSEAELHKKLAALEIAKAEAKLMMLYLERCRVRAPQTGKVTSVKVRVGETVSKGQILMGIVPDK